MRYRIAAAMMSCMLVLTGCGMPAAVQTETKYTDQAQWAYFETDGTQAADVFLVAPTTGIGKGTNASSEDVEYRDAVLGALNMQRGIYEESGRMFAPYYNQATMAVYSMPEEEQSPYLEFAYRDVSDAFAWYMEHENHGRPIILAGFSQGADMCFRLLGEYFGDPAMQDQLVAVYAIGWRCTEEMTEQYPQIVPAKGEDDAGVVVTFECEAPEVTGSPTIPEGAWTYSINPLNWQTDETPADASCNPGACFVGTDGAIRKEIPAFCGCYLDPVRGALKVPDVDPVEYPPRVPGLSEGCYHVYDYLFFYRALQENVRVRTQRYLDSH